jgi:hypothetical protein
MIATLVLKNQLYYWQKTLLVTSLICMLCFVVSVSFVFTSKVKALANKPLESLETEIILQKDRTDKTPRTVKTKGTILPFDLASFPRETLASELVKMGGVKSFSAALVIWQFDLSNTITAIGLDVNDPPVGLRKVSGLLMPGGRFFSSNSADEVILERHFSRLFGFTIGGTYGMNDVRYRIVGIVDFKEQSNLSNAAVFLPYETASKMVGIESGRVNQVYVSLEKASTFEGVKEKLAGLFPDFSIITKDMLVANLSSLNRMFYRFGDYFTIGIFLLAAVLAGWILKMYRLEFREQKEIFRNLGWPRRSSRTFVAIDLVSIVAYSCALASLLVLAFVFFVVPALKFDSLMQQGFKL